MSSRRSNLTHSNFPLTQSQFGQFKTKKFGTIHYIDRNDPSAAPPLDKHMLILFESELEAFLNDNAQDNVDELCKPKDMHGKEVLRTQVPSEKLGWDVDWPEYDPVEYTSPYVLYFNKNSTANGYFKWAHSEDVSECNIAESHAPGGLCLIEGIPRNPFGRTGVKGRGLLGKWGPNQAIDQIVTRWKRNDRQMQIERRGMPMLEVILWKRKLGGEWALPGSFQLKDGVNPLIRKVFGLDPASLQANEDLQAIEHILQQSEVFYHGPTCDPRDTDNAWVESRVLHVHDNTGILGKYHMTDPKDPAVQFVSWAVVHRDMVLFANHGKVLENLAAKLNAYW